MQGDHFDELVEAVLKELAGLGVVPAEPRQISSEVVFSAFAPRGAVQKDVELQLDLPDLTKAEERAKPGIDQAQDAEGLLALMASTPARIGVGRAGPRPRTKSWLLFQGDAAVTQDALWRDVDETLLNELGLFVVQTKVTGGKQEYLLRPDLGRQLSDEARQVVLQRCTQKPNIQLCVGDGLSAAAVEANLRKILPVIQSGCQMAGLSFGVPFFIKYCRVGVMNDVGELLQPDVVMLLIGERPGLGRAESMSVYMGYHPQAGHTDAERDVICNIYDGGGTNPLEAGAYAVQLAQKMIRLQASGVKLKILEGGGKQE
ncbi:MAG: ethanolamine ammonia-lyase subunit EutC [Anaerolineales bacterium]